jgi:hypothetical protein
MPKAVESMVDLYVKLKERKALQSLLDGRQSTYSDFERLNSPKRFLDDLAEEIEIIKAGLDRIEVGDDTAKETQPSEVKVMGIAVSASPATAHAGSPRQVLEGEGATSAAVVTGLSISVSPAPVETDLSSLPPGRVLTNDS